MQVNNLILIASAEVIAVLLIVCILLLIRNSKLRGMVQKLQGRMKELVSDLKGAGKKPIQEQKPSETGSQSYIDHINQQLTLTKSHHDSLGSEQDIVLDLSPDIPIPLRAAALRYAILLAEKEACATEESEEPDWSRIRAKYDQIFSFYEDYVAPESSDIPEDEFEQLQKDLENAKKRISNLEKFKKLYFEMEEQWEASKKTAQTHYNTLSGMASAANNTQEFETALEAYQASYGSFNKVFENSDPITETITVSDPNAVQEIQQLRTVAADQHRIINELKAQLDQASTDEEKNQIVNGLKAELEKQSRFIQESETCIQLMEDELNSANKEAEILRSRLKALPSIKTQLKEAESKRDEFELKVYALTSEKRKLEKRLAEAKDSPKTDYGESNKLKKALSEMETKYADLEEKYLDLKLQG